jgi:tRNA(Ile)-lysidine synthase
MPPGTVDADILDAVSRALAPHRRAVLAVSGGLDSMVLLDAAARACPTLIAAVATFDHGTGRHATLAVALVRARATALGIPCETGRATGALRTEAQWRSARLAFLRRVAAERDAVLVTAHSRDDQVETVAIRILRDAGARGLAGLYAAQDVVRPLLAFPRSDLARCAAARRLRYLTDPSNASRAHLRNRLRLDLLPAIARVRPGFGDELLALSRAAAEWRVSVDVAAASLGARIEKPGSLRIDSSALAGYDPEGLAVLWPALVAGVGVTLDRRGTRRLSDFTIASRTGARIQLSGGYEVVRRRSEFVLRRRAAGAGEDGSEAPTTGSLTAGLGDASEGGRPLADGLRLDGWTFRVGESARTVARGPAGGGPHDGDLWSAELPRGRALRVRAWRAGDRVRGAGASAPRRVKRYFADRRIVGPDRAGWPVVLAGDEIVWVPGVCRSDAATDRSGGPGGVRCSCERGDG